MKKILLSIMILSLSLFANEFKYQANYKKALQSAKDEDKVLIVMMALKGCPVCDYMRDIVFEREQVLHYLNDNYIMVVHDIDHDKYEDRFTTINAPTFYFIDPRTGKEIREKKIGGAQPKKFIQELTEVKERYDNNQTNLVKKPEINFTKNTQ